MSFALELSGLGDDADVDARYEDVESRSMEMGQ